MPINPKPCKLCNEMGHTPFYCRLKKRKPISQRGKQYTAWQKARKTWFASRPEQVWFNCYICNKLLHRRLVTLDHKIPRSKKASLRYAQSNLRACCWTCNQEKGSQSYEQYIKKRRANETAAE